MTWNEIKANFLSLLGITSLPQKEGKLNLSEEQMQLLKESLGDQDLVDNLVKIANQELLQESKVAKLEKERKETAAALRLILEENNIELQEEESEEEEETDPKLKTAKKPANITDSINKLKAELAEKNRMIAKLTGEPELDTAELIKSGNMKIAHSATHLFASANGWDAFADRPWNQRAAGQEVKSESYSELSIDRVVEDFGDYYKQDLNETVSFLRGISRLPSFWGRLSGVQDEAWYVKLFLGEITQGRKKNWLPKGKFEFQPEKVKVYDNQIDLEFMGYELQKLEKTWLGKLNQEGASPFKMSFVAFLMQEIIKKRIEEDEMALIRGIYVPIADDSDKAGSFLHKCEGLLKRIQRMQVERKYLPYDIGTPTAANIVDYVEKFVKSIPKYYRDLPGMVLYMDPDWERAYHKRREEIKGTMPTYQPGKMTVDRYENIRIEPLHFGLGDFMFITIDDNIDLVEGSPTEKNTFTAEKAKRNLAVYADYRIGVHVYAVGYEWPEGLQMTDEKQLFFSNNVEIKLDNYVEIDPNVTTPSAEYHNELQIGVNTGNTAITNIIDVPSGTFVYLYGNSGANPSTIAANAANFDMSAAMTLSENSVIKFYKRPDDGKLVEVWRNENLLEPNYVILDAGATTADATAGDRFITSANAGATALTNIVNAENGDKFRIEGGSSTNATTIAKTGNFSRISASITLSDGNWIDVIYQDGKFIELGRSVA